MNKFTTAILLFAAFTLGQKVTVAKHLRILAEVDLHNEAVFEEMQFERFADGYTAALADIRSGPPQSQPSSNPSTDI